MNTLREIGHDTDGGAIYTDGSDTWNAGDDHECITGPQPHTAAQPGLRGHSVNDATSLMRPVIVYKITEHGKLGVASYNTVKEAGDFIVSQPLRDTYEYEDRSGAWGATK